MNTATSVATLLAAAYKQFSPEEAWASLNYHAAQALKRKEPQLSTVYAKIAWEVQDGCLFFDRKAAALRIHGLHFYANAAENDGREAEALDLRQIATLIAENDRTEYERIGRTQESPGEVVPVRYQDPDEDA